MSLLSSLEIKEIVTKNQPNTSSFVFQHLPTGMGVTIGNYLRRVLLSYISGVAPVAVKIADKNGWVKSKFTTLLGVIETTPYLIVNLKKIVWEEKKEKEGIFSLDLWVENKEKQERIVTAGDFQKSGEVEIKNPELYLATLAPESSLKIEIYCQKNWGYHRAEEQKEEYFSKEEDIIALDTDYSPIKGGQVNFQVRSVIIALEKEEEELNLTITTNGSVKPKKTLDQALELSQIFFNDITKLVSNSKKKEERIIEEIK